MSAERARSRLDTRVGVPAVVPALVGLVTAALLVTVAVVVSAGGLDSIDGSATVAQRAERVVDATQPGDVVAVVEVGELSSDLVAAVSRAAREAGGNWASSRSAMVGLVGVRRAGVTVQQPPPGFRYPVVITGMSAAAAAGVLGGRVADGLGPERVVLGETAAGLRGAQTGDLLDLVADDGSVRSLVVGSVVSDRDVGGAELVMLDSDADRLGIRRVSRAVMWGFSSRTAVEVALARHGITTRRETRAIRSWEPPTPDSTLSTVQTKVALGEFAYRPGSGEWVAQDATWVAEHLPAGRELLDEQIRIRARCHLRVVPHLRAALAEVAAAGLASAIEVANANAYGGCHAPRLNRISAEFGFLSRHAWAMALDTNTASNCQGCEPRMDCRVVVIFRRHGFAWGGNFLRPDGMHFEWVGERRDLVPSTSGRCPNPAPRQGRAGGDSRERILADETLFAGHHDHDHHHDQHAGS